MTLNILKLDIFFKFLEFVKNLRAPLQKFVEESQLCHIYHISKNILDNYVFNISTCNLYVLFSKICKFFLDFLL